MNTGKKSFWEEHRKWILFAAAVLLGATVGVAAYTGITSPRKTVTHITAVYTGDTKAGVVLDDKNPGFTVTAYYKDGHEETVTGWTISSPQTLEDAKKSVVTITYGKVSTQCEIQCSTGMIQSITAEYDGDTTAGTKPAVLVDFLSGLGSLSQTLEGLYWARLALSRLVLLDNKHLLSSPSKLVISVL